MIHFKIKQLLFKQSIFLRFCYLIITFILFTLLGCSSSRQFIVPAPVPDDRRPVAAPKSGKINIAKDLAEKQFFDQIEQSFDLSRQFRNLFGKPKQAYNVNAFDEVANSSWFTNRNHIKRMTLEDIARGPNTGNGPDTSGTWIITSVKVEGVTPGFRIKDSRGVGYVIKFEPIGYSEMPSGAEVVSTKLFYAMGYNVPENYIVYFRLRILRLGEKVKFTDELGRKRYFTEEDLQKLLEKVQILPNGLIRVAASKLLKGKAFLGPFRYKGTRKDDANDVIPHQHRRELRGLRVIAAWLNHFDTKANNSLDVFTEQGYLKHYLIDFGSTLGSNGDEPQPQFIGYENAFDPHQVAKNIITLGLYVRPWEKTGEVVYPSIGNFDSKLFHPQKYKFITPNPAFELMTNRDAFWGAKIVMSFTDEQLQTAVAQGQYSDPNAASYLLQVLKERRDITGRYWFSKMNPLDNFRLVTTKKNGNLYLVFSDLAVEGNLNTIEESKYLYTLYYEDNALNEQQVAMENKIQLSTNGHGILDEFLSTKKITDEEDKIFNIKICTHRNNMLPSKAVEVYFYYPGKSKESRIIGIRREE